MDNTTDDTAQPGKICPKCNELRAPAQFISDKTGRPTMKCQMCRVPYQQTVRDTPGKRRVPASRKAADNTKMYEELQDMCISNKAKTGKKKAVQQNSAAARQTVRKLFGQVKK